MITSQVKLSKTIFINPYKINTFRSFLKVLRMFQKKKKQPQLSLGHNYEVKTTCAGRGDVFQTFNTLVFFRNTYEWVLQWLAEFCDLVFLTFWTHLSSNPSLAFLGPGSLSPETRRHPIKYSRIPNIRTKWDIQLV